MAKSLTAVDAEVRLFTHHTGDTTRLPQATLWLIINNRYRALRTWLQDVAPSLYLRTSPNLVLADGDIIHLISVSATFERLHRVDRYLDGVSRWDEVERAGTENPEQHTTGRITFREEADYLLFGPGTAYGGTYRVLYHTTPANLTSGAQTFDLPDVLLPALIWGSCSDVVTNDTDSPKDFDEKYLAAIEGYKKDGKGGAREALEGRTGVHSQREGLQRRMGRW